MTLRATFLALMFAGAPALQADVTLAPLFADHAVLQRDKPVPVWGRAAPGEKITVAFLGVTVHTEAGAGGRWAAYLGPLAATSAGSDLVVTAKNTLTLHDVVVGEVWLCSGQSNMEFLVDDRKGTVHGSSDQVQNAPEEIAAARHPLIRQFKVGRQVAETETAAAAGAWVPCAPETVGDYTAVGYFFARDIHERLDVPVGLIDSVWGGTPIESWLPPEGLAADPAFAVAGQRWAETLQEYPRRQAAYPALLAEWEKADAAARAAGQAAYAAFRPQHPKPRKPRGAGDPWTPSGLFNGMISPLLPYALRGMLWYQGESNADRAGEYRLLFTTLITAWRARFGQGDVPFYWVQLANYQPPSDQTGVTYAELREAQAQALRLPATGMAVAIDLGDPADIHPKNKQEVGRRLALIAKAETYGIPGDYSGPRFLAAERNGAAMRVRFQYAGSGLTAAGGPLASFELAGADRKFHPAAARIMGDEVWVQAPEVPEPAAVRYAWRDAPEANLYNGAGLPAAPFRSEAW